jgi:exonuclease VII large subunit
MYVKGCVSTCELKCHLKGDFAAAAAAAATAAAAAATVVEQQQQQQQQQRQRQQQQQQQQQQHQQQQQQQLMQLIAACLQRCLCAFARTCKVAASLFATLLRKVSSSIEMVCRGEGGWYCTRVAKLRAALSARNMLSAAKCTTSDTSWIQRIMHDYNRGCIMNYIEVFSKLRGMQYSATSQDPAGSHC